MIEMACPMLQEEPFEWLTYRVFVCVMALALELRMAKTNTIQTLESPIRSGIVHAAGGRDSFRLLYR